MTRRREDAVLCEAVCDRAQPFAAEELAEDALDDWSGNRIAHERAQVLAEGGLARIWMRAGVG